MKKEMKFKKQFRYMKTVYNRIHLVDKCLMVFMIVLLTQSTYSLFFHGVVSEEIGSIDVIVRTSAAAIFGYFLSANFVKDVPETDKEPELLENTGDIKSQELEEENFHKQPICNSIQIIIASVIGLFCLTVLILIRDMAVVGSVAGSSVSAAATVTQFRDFVSGCVGFLIGSPTHGRK